MREVIAEGRGYISIHLTPPLSRYLEPLKEETFLSSDEVVRLVGNIQEIVHFQKEFLKNLEECVDDESFLIYTKPQEFKVSHPPPGSNVGSHISKLDGTLLARADIFVKWSY